MMKNNLKLFAKNFGLCIGSSVFSYLWIVSMSSTIGFAVILLPFVLVAAVLPSALFATGLTVYQKRRKNDRS